MFLTLIAAASALDNGLARTPPMGWMQWEQFRCEVDCQKYPNDCISEKLFTDMIDHMAADGWLDYGYSFVDIDDCWMGPGRDENDELYPDPARFPHGIKWLADYAHQKGVKLGIYNDYGTLTCGGYTGSEGYLLTDARTFAKWEVDKLKMDGCYSELLKQGDAYPAMMYFLNKTGRPIIYSCSWPAYDMEMDYGPLPEHCNMWRNWDDIRAEWSSIQSIIDKWGDNPHWADYAGPGHWNDPDMVLVGFKPTSWGPGLTHEEERTQFAIWSILAAPLILSIDLRQVPAESKKILTNREVIAVDQDPLGKQGKRLTPKGNSGQVWVRQLQDGWAVGLLNQADNDQEITVQFSDFTSENRFKIRDLWEGKDLGTYTQSFCPGKVKAHDTLIYKLVAA